MCVTGCNYSDGVVWDCTAAPYLQAKNPVSLLGRIIASLTDKQRQEAAVRCSLAAHDGTWRVQMDGFSLDLCSGSHRGSGPTVPREEIMKYMPK